MAEDLDEIMGYLGLGPLLPKAPSARQEDGGRDDAAESAPNGEDRCIFSSDTCSLWVSGNENAEWIEVRGEFPTIRATRTKARLLCLAKMGIEHWAGGRDYRKSETDLSIVPVHRFGVKQLEIKYKTWKPLRLSREQAGAVISCLDAISSFAKSS